jgi:hypothetical protein
MKTLIAMLLMVLPAMAGDECLVVYPRSDLVKPWGVSKIHYIYADSQGLRIAEVKDKYSKKDLEKMERAGVKIVSVPAPDRTTVNVKVNRPAAYDAAALKEACEEEKK